MKIQAMFDKNQIKNEADEAAWEIQKELDKKRPKVDIEANVKLAQKVVDQFKKDLEDLKKSWANVEVLKTAERNLTNAYSALASFKKELKEVSDVAEEESSESKWMGKFMKNLRNTAVRWAVIWFAKKLSSTLIELWTNYSKVADEFDRFTGDSQVTKDLLSELSTFASNNWLDLTNVRETASSLLQMWVAAEDLVPTMQQLGDISAWTGASMEDLADILWTIEKEWKLTKDSFNDLVKAWVPIWDQLAEDLWLTVDQVKKLASEWKITDEQVSTAFQHMTEEWGVFFWMLDSQSWSIGAKMNNLKTSLTTMWENIATAVLPAFEQLIWDAQDTTDALMETSQTWSSWMLMLQKWVYVVVQAFRGLIKIVQNFWTFLGTIFGSAYTIVTSFATDVWGVFVKLFSADTRVKLWNNIAYWIGEWVNKAIGSINKLIEQANKIPWINIGTVKGVNWWEKSNIWFDFSNTSNAIKWATQAMNEAMEDVWEWRIEFWQQYMEWRNNIWKETEKAAKKTNATFKDMIDENVKNSSGWSKKIVEQKKEELKKLRDQKIAALNTEVMDEKEKSEKLLEIYNRYKEELIKLEDKTNDELLKNAEEYLKEYQKEFEQASKKDQDAVNDSIKKVEDYNKKIEKLGSSWDDYKNKAIKNLREVNNSIKELEEDFNKDIAKRYSEVWQTIKDFERKNSSTERLKSLWVDRLRDRTSDKINDINVNDAIKYLEALEEMEYLNSKLNDSQKELADTLERQSKSEELILEYEKKRSALEEEKAIYEAFSSQGSLWDIEKKAIKVEDDIVSYYDKTKDQYVEITDFKNQELARELDNQQTKLNTEYDQLVTAKNNELDLIETTSKQILKRWELDTEAYKLELKNRTDAVRTYVNNVKDLLSSIPSSYRAYWGTLNSWVTMVGENWPEAIIGRQSSYVQPRNAVQTNSTVYNNQSSLSINWLEVWSFNSIEDLLNWLKPYLTRRN